MKNNKVEELENIIIDTIREAHVTQSFTIKSKTDEEEIKFSLDTNLTKREIKTIRKKLTRRTEILEDGKILLINHFLLLLDWLRGNQTHQTIIVNYQVI